MVPCSFARGILPPCKLTETVSSWIGRCTGDNSDEGCNEERKQSETHGEVVQRILILLASEADSQAHLYLQCGRLFGGLFGVCFNERAVIAFCRQMVTLDLVGNIVEAWLASSYGTVRTRSTLARRMVSFHWCLFTQAGAYWSAFE